MKAPKYLLLCTLLLAGASSAWADGRWHGRHGSIGIYVGPGAYWGPPIYRPYYYPDPFLYSPYYMPPPVVVAPAPQVYIEQNEVAVEPSPAPAATNYWHYCRESKSYYPYVKECPGGWQKVLPQPAK